MTAIRLIQTPVDGKLIIDLPEEMRDEALVIEFRPEREIRARTLAEVSDDFFNNLKRPTPSPDFDPRNPYEQ